MRNIKFIVAGVFVLLAGVLLSAFRNFDTPVHGAGSYAAKYGVSEVPYSYDTISLTTIRTGDNLPPFGADFGECLLNTLNICAARYDINGNLLDAKTGTYIEREIE